TVEGDRAALWLGPDEWLLIAPEPPPRRLAAALAEALTGLPHSLVDVSHRQSALALSGPQATTLLAAGCPLDLDPAPFPVGMCTRTILAKAEVLLWRTGPQVFRVEDWRSFVVNVSQFLGEASRGIIRGESPSEGACSGSGHRWRRGRGVLALSPDEERLDGCRADRAHGAHRGLHLARRGPLAAVQHELHRRPAAQVLGRSLQALTRGDRPGRELSRHRQSAPRNLQ